MNHADFGRGIEVSLLIARHGQTDWNLEQRWQSVSDIPLNAEGQNQAARLAALLEARECVPHLSLIHI